MTDFVHLSWHTIRLSSIKHIDWGYWDSRDNIVADVYLDDTEDYIRLRDEDARTLAKHIGKDVDTATD